MTSSDYNNTTNFGDEDDDYTEKTIDEYNLKECTVYAIDCRPSMFEQDEHGQVPVTTALRSIRSKLVDQIKWRPNDQSAIVLFGTKEKKNMPDRDHIYVLQTLDTPDAVRIKQLDSLIEDISQLKDTYGSTDKLFPISDLFWICSDIKSSAPKLSTIRVILITDNDDPTNGLAEQRKPAIQRAKDLTTVGIEIILFGLDGPDQPFDKDLFYKDIVAFVETADDTDEFNTKTLSCTGKLDELFDKMKTVQTSTRSEFRVPFQIAPNLTIGIRGYNMVIEKKMTAPKLFFSSEEQLKEVKSVTRWRCVDTDQILLPIDIKNSYSYGGEFVVFTKDEINEIKTINSPGLLVLGFREMKALKAYHQVSHPYFIYPDESQYKQSKNVFFLLLNTLLKKNQIAICSFVRRSNTIPKMVALLPQAEKLDKDGYQIDPPGFQLIILPYAEDIRNIPPYTVAEDYENGCEAAKPLIEKLKIKEGFNPMTYPNPYLQHQNNMIQSVALESQNDNEESVDNSIPDYQYIESELADDVEMFKKIVGLDMVTVDDILENNAKRKAMSSNMDDANKRPKLKEMTIEEHWQANTLGRVTNPSLKEYLTSKGIQPKKLKSDLIDQVDAVLRTKMET